MKNLDDFVTRMFSPVEDKPGYIWINKRNHEMAKADLVKERIEKVYEQYCISQGYTRNDILEKRFGIPMEKSNNTQEARIPLCKGLQTDMAIIDDFLAKEDKE